MDYLTVALVLIGIGAVLLAAEILIPTGGFLVVGALLFFALGVGTIVYYGDTLEATVALAGLAVGLPASGFVAVAAWRRMSIGNALDAASGTSIPSEWEHLKGKIGKTVSPLRPSGSVEFEGQRIDSMTEGMMIDAGVWVRCVDIKSGRVIVRQMDTPTDLSDLEPGSTPSNIDLDLDFDRP